jgi:transposase InsO family protein
MPWNNTCPMNERQKFIRDWLTRNFSMIGLCHEHRVSRKTGYKWLQRFRREGQKGLNDKSRKPHSHPLTTCSRIEQEILSFRALHPFWGPRKIRSRLQRLSSAVEWPAASTIGSILRRNGVVIPRRRRARVPAFVGEFNKGLAPNDVWAADFKGRFRTKAGEKVDPFTLSDVASRYLLRCQAVSKTNWANIRIQLTAAFQEFGLPRGIRTDNGSPFASCGLCGLSRLSVWLLRLGVTPERIRPGHPEENGVHERMHRTLKQATARPPKATLVEQQQAFDRFRVEYNDERPHEALGMRTPSELYAPSPRCFPRELPGVEYKLGMRARRINQVGQFRWKKRQIYVSASLAYERVGLLEVDNDVWDLYFKEMKLGQINLMKKGGPITVTPVPG